MKKNKKKYNKLAVKKLAAKKGLKNSTKIIMELVSKL